MFRRGNSLTSSSVDKPRSLLEVLESLEVDESASLVVERAVDGHDVALKERERRDGSGSRRKTMMRVENFSPEPACPQASRLVGTSKRRKRAWEEERSRTVKRRRVVEIARIRKNVRAKMCSKMPVTHVEKLLAVEGNESLKDSVTDPPRPDGSNDLSFEIESVSCDLSDVPVSSLDLLVSGWGKVKTARSRRFSQ